MEVASTGEMAEALSQHMLGSEVALAGREALPIGARRALDSLIAASGRMPAAVFERRFGTLRPMGPGRLERERPWLSPANPTEVLWYRGFVFRAFDKTPNAPVEMMFVPSDLLELMPAPEPSGSPGTNGDGLLPTHITQTSQGSPDPLLDDVTTILAYIQNYEVHTRADGGWNGESRTAIQPMLRDPDGTESETPSGRFGFLLSLVARVHWLRLKEKELRLVPQSVSQWLQNTPQLQRSVLFNAWRGDPHWNDLAHVQGIAFEMPHAWSNDPVRERNAILEMLVKYMTATSEPWQDIDAFVDEVKRANPDFARPDGRYDTWHIRDVRTNEYLTSFDFWDRVEGALIRYIITGPLAWLGIVNVLEGRIALTDAAPLLSEPLNEVTPPVPETSPRHTEVFRLEPDGDVIVHTSARFERFQLSRVANWMATRNDDYVFRLAPESVNAAMKQGIAAPRILEFLEQHSSKPVPPNLVKAIKRLEQFGAEARMEQAYLLRTKDAVTLNQLLNTHAVRKAMIERISPTCALMRQREARAVASAIIRTGLLIDL